MIGLKWCRGLFQLDRDIISNRSRPMGRVLTQTANHRSPCGPRKVTVRPLQSMVRPPQGRGVPRSSYGDRTVASRWPRGDLRFLLSLGCLKITRQPYDIQHIVRSPHACRTGERLSHKAMLTNPPTHICVTWLQGVNEISIIAVTGMLQDKHYSKSWIWKYSIRSMSYCPITELLWFKFVAIQLK